LNYLENNGSGSMINRLQKCLWILSSGAPILLAFSITWVIKGKPYVTSLIALVVAILFMFVAFIVFHIIKNKLPILQFRAKKITQKDMYVIKYAISYLVPFASIAFNKYNPYVFLVIALIIFVTMLIANTPTANPLLFFGGYHFYDVEGENGIGNYLVISNKAIRNREELKKVIRITEYLLLDVSEGR
jgi:hypothetical protein